MRGVSVGYSVSKAAGLEEGQGGVGAATKAKKDTCKAKMTLFLESESNTAICKGQRISRENWRTLSIDGEYGRSTTGENCLIMRQGMLY